MQSLVYRRPNLENLNAGLVHSSAFEWIHWDALPSGQIPLISGQLLLTSDTLDCMTNSFQTPFSKVCFCGVYPAYTSSKFCEFIVAVVVVSLTFHTVFFLLIKFAFNFCFFSCLQSLFLLCLSCPLCASCRSTLTKASCSSFMTKIWYL